MQARATKRPLNGSKRTYMHTRHIPRGSRSAALALVALEGKPCGCVAGIYRATPSVVEVELVEAKGPHCRFHAHRAGQVISLGVPEVFEGSLRNRARTAQP